MSSKPTPRPTRITLHQRSRLLEVAFDTGETFSMSCEYLRVFSPSAEVRGHGPGQEVLQIGKENVNITRIDPVGHYAVRLHFDDGHHTGLYSWSVLYELGTQQSANWNTYLQRLKAAGHQRKGE
ncbi:MAG: DUF971 domain-containing protein [Pseudomonadota bacterium]|nr:DUF971 domain-containing protein [Pseudomonadota bacterium]